jgi:hypothetical protein
VLTAEELLLEGERMIGDYNLEIARWHTDHWATTIPPLYAILTDHRLILQPHTRKRHDPAIIPASYISRVQDIDEGNRFIVVLHLKNDQKISMFIPKRQHTEIMRNLRTVTAPNAPRKFEVRLDLGSLKKLIEFVSDL